MYSVLIVDDEVITCNGLAKIMSNIRPYWKIETAYDGKEGIKKFQENHFDVLITDIKMPFMDGIDLIQQIKAIQPETICIIQSAYSDFEYARNALKMGVTDYILKPIGKKGIKELIDKIEGYIESSIIANRKSISDLEKINFMLEYKTISENSNIMIVIVEVGNATLNPHLIKLIRGLFPDDLNSSSFFSNELGKEEIVNIINSPCKNIDMGRMLQSIRNTLLLDHGLSCRFYASEYFPYDKSNVTLAYSQAKTAKEFNFYFDRDQLLFEVLNGRYVSILRLPDNLENKFVTSFFLGNKSGTNQLIDFLFTELTREKLLYPSIVKEKVKYLFSSILSNMRSAFWENKDQFLQDLCAQIDSSPYIGDLKSVLECATDEIYTIMNETNENANSHIVQNSIRYIMSNLDGDLSLDAVAGKFSFSSSYFSKVFKDTTGMSYIEFLLNQRIEKAKQLLESTNLKVYLVSLRVGYDNVGYFNRVFKKRTGLSPEEYRKSYK